MMLKMPRQTTCINCIIKSDLLISFLSVLNNVCLEKHVLMRKHFVCDGFEDARVLFQNCSWGAGMWQKVWSLTVTRLNRNHAICPSQACFAVEAKNIGWVFWSLNLGCACKQIHQCWTDKFFLWSTWDKAYISVGPSNQSQSNKLWMKTFSTRPTVLHLGHMWNQNLLWFMFFKSASYLMNRPMQMWLRCIGSWQLHGWVNTNIQSNCQLKYTRRFIAWYEELSFRILFVAGVVER